MTPTMITFAPCEPFPIRHTNAHNVPLALICHPTSHPVSNSPPKAVSISADAPILGDFWKLTWTLSDSLDNTSWALEWKCLLRCSNGLALGNTSPGRRADATGWIFQDTLFVYGGFGSGANARGNSVDHGGVLSDVWSYDIAMEKWTLRSGSVAPMMTPPSSPDYDGDGSSQNDNGSSQNDNSSDSVISLGSRDLPSLAGASAVVRDVSGFKPLVVITAGHAFGSYSNLTYFFDMSSNNTTATYAQTSPRGRLGAVIYQSLLAPRYVYFYGGFNSDGPAYDLWVLNTVNGDWEFRCDSKFCGTRQSVAWCFACTLVIPTKDYQSGLRYASYVETNSTSGSSRLILGGQSMETGSWLIANWTVLTGTRLPYPQLVASYCAQPNPAPSSPHTFQCVDGKWVATNICPSCPTQLSLPAGAPIVILGNWLPTRLSLEAMPGSYLNITGTFDVGYSNMTTNVSLPLGELESFRPTQERDSISFAIIESAVFNGANVAIPPLVSNTQTVSSKGDSPCEQYILSEPTWATSTTISGRQTLDIVLKWNRQIAPSCEQPPSLKKRINVPLVAISSSVGALFIVAAVVLLLKFQTIRDRLQSSKRPSSDLESSSTDKSSMTDTPPSTQQVTIGGTTIAPESSQMLLAHEDDSIITGAIDISASDLDYESGLGSLETSFDNEFELEDTAFIPDLSQV